MFVCCVSGIGGREGGREEGNARSANTSIRIPRSFSCGGLGSRTAKVVMPVMRCRRARAAAWWVVLEAKTCERSCASERGGGDSVVGGEAVGVVAVGGGCAVVETGREARRERSWVVRSVFWSSSDASWEWSVGGAAGGTAGESGVAMVGRVCCGGGGYWGEATGGRV